MNAVLRNFKLIPCPAGDGCSKPTCPWQHARDQTPAAAQPDPAAADGGSQDQDGPRKRRKVFSEPASTPAQPASSSEAGQPSSVTRPVSPPPLRRRAPKPPTKPLPSAASPAGLTPPPTTTTKPSPSASAVAPSSAPAPMLGPQSTTTTTTTTTHQKVVPQRGATPQQKVAPRKPETLNPRHLKTAAPATHDFRYKVLKLLHEQFQRLNNELKKDAKDDEEKLVLSAQELIWLALDEEQKMATEKPSVYQNIIKNRITTYKRMTPGQWKTERAAERNKKNAAAAPGSGSPRKPLLGPPKVVDTGLTPQQEVEFLTHLLTPIDSLAKWGYVPTPPSDKEIAKAREGEEAALGYEVCDRCTTRFQVFPGRREEDGALTSGGKCVHHPGRFYFPERTLRGDSDRPAKRYRCCQQVVGESPGCVSGATHVFKTTSPARLAALVPFAETPGNEGVPPDRAVCFDCEMGYTVRGMELLRLTATSWPDGRELLDVLVRPVGEILDLNSRYSGVWPEHLVNAQPWSESDTTQLSTQHPQPPASDETNPPKQQKKTPMKIVPSPTAARTLLFSLLSPSTPLIGHGLENDLNAARIIHPTLIDTILLFPHPRGLPMRHGLKMLMETRLNKAIQVEVEGGVARGHDSGEDARAAGELVRLVVGERWKGMRMRGWKVGSGGFVAPEGEEGTGEGGLSERFLEEGEVKDA
ncbi:hypothetical protein C8A05DRAFT_13030 [Staphylotrichum tortipilum]|uniref:Exonuclease domain-containing protein n=1 Tax=Staphylotrichum tortipilum TaxID=2831512 RepID=A0AAN6MRI8_9PEZI|nr:hypothetical protein C8A05DRAFT_13030 [Staphylotrichum longicolle]